MADGRFVFTGFHKLTLKLTTSELIRVQNFNAYSFQEIRSISTLFFTDRRQRTRKINPNKKVFGEKNGIPLRVHEKEKKKLKERKNNDE